LSGRVTLKNSTLNSFTFTSSEWFARIHVVIDEPSVIVHELWWRCTCHSLH